MSKRTKILIILIALIIALITILILRANIEKKEKENKIYTSLQELKTPEDVIRYLGSEFIKEEKSKDSNIKTNIYLRFKVDLFTDGTSNKDYYYKLMDGIAYVLNYNNFKLIDTDKQIEIEVICDSKNKVITSKYINGDRNYFGNTISKMNMTEIKEIPTTKIEINSDEVNALINNNWKSSTIDDTKKTNSYNKYNIYGNDQIEIKTVYKKVFNIVFTKNYTKSVVNGIKPNTSAEEIQKILGKPTIETDYKEVFGYKSDKIYVIFNNGEISIYRVEDFDSTEFAKLVKEYIDGLSVKDFVNKLTDIWPDYDQYYYDTDFVNLIYTLKGIKIQFNITANHGIIVYNNYTGQIIEGKTINSISLEELKNKVYFENTNMIIENELERSEFYLPDYGE